MPKRGENIRKRKDGRWEGRYIKCYSSDTHRPKYASVYGKTYREAKQKLINAKQNCQPIQNFPSKPVLFYSEVIDSWLKSRCSSLKPSTISKYYHLFQNHIIPQLGHLKTTQLNEGVLSEFIAVKSNTSQPQLSKSTLHSLLYLLNATVAYGASLGLMTNFSIHRPACGVNPKPVHILSPAEEDALEKYLAAHMTQSGLGILFSLYCGLRLGEVCGLKWEDIDFTVPSVAVRRTVQRLQKIDIDQHNKTILYVGQPKSISSQRMIPLPEFFVPILKQFYSPHSVHAYILSGSETTPKEPRTYQYYFKKVLTCSGICPTNYHALRHTFATNCVNLGFDIKSLSEILGHSTVSMTLNKYVHPTMSQKQMQMNSWNTFKGHLYGQNSVNLAPQHEK